MVQATTTQARFELLANELHQGATALALPFEERIGVLLNNALQHRVLGTMTPIARSPRPLGGTQIPL